MRAGTLDDEGKRRTSSDAHVFTSTKLGWVHLSAERERGVSVWEEKHRKEEVWREDALERFKVLRGKILVAKREEEEGKGKEKSEIH